MKFELFNKIIDFFNNNYFLNGDVLEYSIPSIIRLAIDAFLILALVIGSLIFLSKATNKKVLFLSAVGMIVILILIIALDLYMMFKLFPYLVVVYLVVWLIYYAPSIRTMFGDIAKPKKTKAFLTDVEAQENLISTLMYTVEHLSSRKIGAIITIEKEDSLNTYINKGTKLNSEISFELLTTIFMPGTALHDGAVIIRGKQIMSAAAFYPSTDKNDIPKNFGSRHRAAIGISEVTDAFTIVVSEETGRIAITMDGNLTPNVSLESLRVLLRQNIIVE